MKNEFYRNFQSEPQFIAKSFGRFEILGNHTDHNGGLCLAATCELEVNGLISIREDNYVSAISQGFDQIMISLDYLEPLKDELNSSAGLIRGIARYLKDKGYKIGGFNLYSESTIFKGAGVSSSAAFEIFIGQIFNCLYNDNKIDQMTLAKAGQFSENIYFGKKCGLLDQTSISFGSLSFLDFKDKENLKVENVSFPFDDVDVILVNTGGDHSSMSHLYSNIPTKMFSAAKKMNHERLIEGSLNEVSTCKVLTEEEKRFALHFYSECERVNKMKEALRNKDKKEFYSLINLSRESSTNNLRNMQVEGQYKNSPLEACDLFMKLVGKNGACKINGGGFAGSIVCFADKNISHTVVEKMSEIYGKTNVKIISIVNSSPRCERIK